MRMLAWLWGSAAVAWLFWSASIAALGAGPQVVVEAGDFERVDAISRIQLREGWQHYNQLGAPDGTRLPLQVDAQGAAWFILPRLAKRAVQIYSMESVADTPLPAQAQARRRGHDLVISLPRRGEVLAYRAEPAPPPRPDVPPAFLRAGYLHPVRTPSGRVVTDDVPRAHLHHHGVWMGWSLAEFEGRKPNFWELGEGRGTIAVTGVDPPVSGAVFARFHAAHRFMDLTAAAPKPVLEESWEVCAFNLGEGGRPYYLFDLVSTQVGVGGSDLKLPQFRYGGLGLRGPEGWLGKTNAVFLTSSGETDRVKGNQSRARWCYFGGQVDGQLAGLAVLDHPANFRAPQPLRLHPEEPFVGVSPCPLGDFTMSPGQPFVWRYRFVVFDGAPNAAELDRLWNDFATPPQVNFVMPQ